MPKFLCLHILLTAAVASFPSPLPDTLSAYATDNPENAVAVMTPEDRIKTYERLARESDGADAERYIDMMMQAAKESGSHEMRLNSNRRFSPTQGISVGHTIISSGCSTAGIPLHPNSLQSNSASFTPSMKWTGWRPGGRDRR